MGGMARGAAKEVKGAGIHVHHEFTKSQVSCGRGSAGERRLGCFGLQPVGRLYRSGHPGHRVDRRPGEHAFDAGHHARLTEHIAQCDPGDRRGDRILAEHAAGGAAPPQTGTDTFIAEGQDVHGTALYEPACTSGCLLSGDSTAILARMTWTTWSTEAVGTGTYKLDDCVPNCAAGEVFDVATVVTFSRPLLVCLTSTPRWFWSRASFTFPDGLPKALQGSGAPQNPWTFSSVVTEAQETCVD